MNEHIEPFSYAEALMKALPKGVLLSTEKKGAMNTMVIGWGALGTNWGKPVLTVYVRESRLTRDYLDASGEFTVNVPLGAVDPKIIKVCGSKSGRDLDKIKTLSLTVQQGETVKAPAFKELPLTFECKVLFRQVEALENLAQQEGKWYPADQNGNKDRHIQYIAEITSAYIVK